MHSLGGRGGPHRGGERGGPVVRRGVVVGDGGRRLRVVPEALLERPGERQMPLGPLAGQQVRLDDLAQQRMAEPVQAVVLDGQDVPVDRLAERLAQRSRLEPGRLLEQAVVEPLPDGDEPEQLAGGVGQALDAQDQGVAQRVRGGAAAVEPGGQQLLAEQRIAGRARPEPVQQLGVRRRVEDVRQLLGQLLAAQRRERDAARAGMQLELGQQRAQRMAAQQLVGSIRAHDEHALLGQPARQERQRRARRAVGPMQVLDHQEHRSLTAERVEQRQQTFEQLRLIARVGAGSAGQQRGDRVVQRRVGIPRQRAQRRHQRQVGQLALIAEVDAVTGQHERAAVARPGGQLGQQPRLADARLPGDERQRRPPGGGIAERRLEVRQLRLATDKPGARDARHLR